MKTERSNYKNKYGINLLFNPLWAASPLMGTMANGEAPDEMTHEGAFHQGQHCLLRQNQTSEKEIQHFWKL